MTARLRASYPPLSVAVVLTVALLGCSGGAPVEVTENSLSPLQAQIAAYARAQDRRLTSSGQHAVIDTAVARSYPSKMAIGFLSFTRILGTSPYLSDATSQLDYAHEQETATHLVAVPADLTGDPRPMASSYAQSSLAFGYWMAYRFTGAPRYLAWADDALGALLDLETTQECTNGKCAQVWYYTYELASPNSPIGEARIDPNQDAGTGLTLTLMLNQQGSRFYHSPQVAALARQELDAAFVLMDTEGRLPLNSAPSNLDKFDTNYGAATLFRAAWANEYWHDAAYSTHLRLGAQWEGSYTTDTVSTQRYLPAPYSGPIRDPGELYRRLGLFVLYGGDTAAVQRDLARVWSDWAAFAQAAPSYDCAPFAMLEELGVPQTMYWR